MRSPAKLLSILVCVAAVLVGGSLSAAPARKAHTPHRYQPRSLDRQLVRVVSPVDGTTWAAWAYRSGAEFDVAVSSLGADGVWSEILFFGGDDGADQTDPALAVDATGNLYLAYADAATGRILLAGLQAGAEAWTTPRPIGGLLVAEPGLRIVGDRLVIAYRSDGAVALIDVPLLGGDQTENGMTDNPDPVGDQDKGDDDDWDWTDDPPVGDGPVNPSRDS